MGPLERYLANPTPEGARYLGRLTTQIVPPDFVDAHGGTPPPPAELLPEHVSAFLEGYTLERLSQASGSSPSWYGPLPTDDEPRGSVS